MSRRGVKERREGWREGERWREEERKKNGRRRMRTLKRHALGLTSLKCVSEGLT